MPILAALWFVLLIIAMPATVAQAAELKSTDIVVGTGDEAVANTKVTVHYTGWLEDGKKFDSSLDRGRPFSFTLGAGRVIQGWDQGVKGMKVGGKRELVIPPELGYGARGAGNAIPPNATLKFEIELLAVAPPPFRNVGNDELQELLKGGARLVDIRRPDEWEKTGIIKGSTLLTAFDGHGRFIRTFPDTFTKDFPKDQEVILICQHGNRSSSLAQALADRAGYAKVVNVTKGIDAWLKAGLPVEKWQPPVKGN